MKRLTEKAPKPSVNSQYVKRKGFYTADCIERLGMYEDTGLTPEEIRELNERDTAKMCKQSIFDHDSITCVCGSDMDKDVEFMFCPWCGQRLKKWEE